ncbi:hypothetical protein SAMN05442782_9552 [Streptomyces sp. OK228]|nr:hypothetical protein SAMN05442782_9552 [Streptomyces sp. OK228]
MDSTGVELAGQCLQIKLTRGPIAFGTKRSWVQIPPPRQLNSSSEGPYRIGKGPLALLRVYLRD